MPSKKRATPISLQPLDALFGTSEETTNGISEIAIGSLHPFPNHPFQVKDDKKMEELSESITQYGVLVPGIVRLRESGGYELVAGHRRKRACELAGLEKMPVIIKDITDDEATVIMVDAYGHFPRPSGPRSPARQGHIKRPVLRLAEPSFLRPANQCC